MPLRTAEEVVPWPQITTFATVAAGSWLCYRHYAAAAERLQRREVIPFGELRLVEKGQDPKFEIIAVQGLGSHPDRTWKSKEQNDEAVDNMGNHTDLLKDLLPAHFKHARITQWVYNSDWDHDGSVASLPDFGQDFLRQLDTHREYYGEEGMVLPVIFLGHSFGGLVIKEAFVAAPDDNPIWTATRGVIFLGTPHMGSSLWRFAAAQALFNRLLGSNVDLAGAISLHNSHLKHLKDKFNECLAKGLSRAIRIVSISEAKPVYLFGLSWKLVVEHYSSEEHSQERVRWACGHTELNKFPGIHDSRFRELANQIERLTPSYILRTVDKRIREVCYADEKLGIYRISGHRLGLEACYINLGLVQVPSKGQKDSEYLGAQSSEHTLMTRLRLKEPESEKRKELTNLFDPVTIGTVRKNVTRVLIYGRAGIGKSSLCKKIVDEFKKKNIWQTKFDRLLWIPLRDMKGLTAGEDPLKTVLDHAFFKDYYQDDKLAERMSQQLWLEKFHRTVFLLDGLDEAISEFGDLGSKTILRMLVNMPNVVITSRPHFHLPEEMDPFDIEMEVLGFTLDQVDDYIGKCGCHSPDDIRKFLQANDFVHDLVRIPIQLDALCYTWDGLYVKEPPRTMTELYQALQVKLAQKDLERDSSQHENNTRSQLDIRKESETSTNLLMALAFSGMCLNEVNFDKGLRDIAMDSFGPEYYVPRTTSVLQGLSFVRLTTGSSSQNADSKSYHFLHLTYQEYFAAQYFVRQWQEKKSLVVLSKDGPVSFNKAEVKVEEFVKKKKYSPTLDVFWRFVCGLLPKGQQGAFFRLIGQNPDILGPAHQRLIMHCLAEASLNLPVRDQLECELRKWAYFELSHTDKNSHLASEAEFPELAIDHILSNDHFKLRWRYLEALSERNSLSSVAVTKVYTRVVVGNEGLRHSGRSLLAAFNLPKGLADQILERTRDPNAEIALASFEILMSQEESPVPPQTIEEYAKSSDPKVSWTLFRILDDCKHVPDAFLPSLPSWRQGDNQNLRIAAIKILRHLSPPHVKIVEEISLPHEDDATEVRDALMEFFTKLRAPTPRMLESAVRNWHQLEMQTRVRGHQLLRDDRFLFYGRAQDHQFPADYCKSLRDKLFNHHGGALGPIYATLLRSCPRNEWLGLLEDLEMFDSLSSDVIQEVAHLMQDNDVIMRRKAFWILATEESLDQETLAVMRQNLEPSLQQIAPYRGFRSRRIRSRRMLSNQFILGLRPLLQDNSHPLQGQAIQVLKGEVRIMDGILESLIPAFGNFHTINQGLLKLCHRLKYLPKELELSLASLLANPDQDIQSESGRILGHQSSLRLATLGAIVMHLRGQSDGSRLAAIQAVSGLKLLPGYICDIFCDLLQHHKATRVPICEVLQRDKAPLQENLSEALAELFQDGDPVRNEVTLLFQHREKRTVPISTIRYVIRKFSQCHGKDNQSIRISMAKAMGVHIADTELVPAFIQILCKDIAEVQIAFLESFIRLQSISNRIGEELLPLFDTHCHGTLQPEQKANVQRLLVHKMWSVGEKTATRKVALKMIQLLDDDNPRVKRLAGKILAQYESDEYLHLFARLLRDPSGEVREMAYDALTDLSKSFKLPSECLEVLRGLLCDKSIHEELKKKVFNILKFKDFDHRTKSARDLLVQVLPFLESKEFCRDTIQVLTKFGDLSGQNMGYFMLKVPSKYERSQVVQLFLSRCNTEELQTLLNDLDQTISLYSTVLDLSWDKAVSMHFINETELQFSTPIGIKTITIQTPNQFLANMEKFREKICRDSRIEQPLSIKDANLLDAPLLPSSLDQRE